MLHELARREHAIETRQACAEFNNLALWLLKGKGDLQLSLGMATAVKNTPPRVLEVLKSASAAGTTTDVAWAGALQSYRYLADSFVEALRNVGVFDRMLNSGMKRLPLQTRIVQTTSVVTATIVGQGSPKTISRLTLTGDQLDRIKASATIIMNDELVMAATGIGAMGYLGRELQNGVALSTDTQFLSIITNGVSPIASSGITSLDCLTDLQSLMAAITTGTGSALFYVMTPALAKQLSLKATIDGALLFPDMSPTGGYLGNVPALVSDGVTAGEIILIDASGIAGGSEAVILDATGEATLALDSAPDDPTTASTVMTSLWQHNLRALRAERWFGVTKFRSTSVAVLSGADYHDQAGSGS
jgi:hypothetical protein